MDRATFEKQQAFAGTRQPSMKRRCLDHDYTERRMYMVTLVTEGRRKLFGDVAGRSDAPTGSADFPHMELSQLGEAVEECWNEIPKYYPEIKCIKIQMMPDHLHGILLVQQKMDNHLGEVIKGFKTGCNKAYRRMGVGCVATMLQHTEQEMARQHTEQEMARQHTEHQSQPQQLHTGHEKGLLFERGYNDRILLRDGQLQRWVDYLADNPRRLLAKREHPDMFHVAFGLQYGKQVYAAIGNQFLLQRPYKLQVQCSRKLTSVEIEETVNHYMDEAAQGAVLVSPALSLGEKAVMRSALDNHYPTIYLSPKNFNAYTKPGGAFTEACANGHFLILAPWDERTDTKPICRQECLMLNDMAKEIVIGD